jgi:hypothetical protein
MMLQGMIVLVLVWSTGGMILQEMMQLVGVSMEHWWNDTTGNDSVI